MSERYIAFLRAINVGGRRVTKERLKELFEALGFGNVSTYLASGNVVFETSDARGGLESQIAAHLAQGLGYEVPTFVRTMDETAQIAEAPVFTGAAREGATTKQYVILTDQPLEQAHRRTLAGLSSSVDMFFADGTEIYWQRDVDAGESIPTGDLERALGLAATRRNLNTMHRLVAKFGG